MVPERRKKLGERNERRRSRIARDPEYQAKKDEDNKQRRLRYASDPPGMSVTNMREFGKAVIVISVSHVILPLSVELEALSQKRLGMVVRNSITRRSNSSTQYWFHPRRSGACIA
ncbi:hypothetical protein VTO58DRAFT_101533 [Aureobasidium pullulans]